MSQVPAFLFQTPTPIELGVGVAAHVGERAAALRMRHVLLITDRGLADSAMCAAAQAALSRAGVAVTRYADVVLDPTDASVAAAAAAYGAAGADGMVALGGGSAMDTAKAAGVLAADRADDIAPYFFGGSRRPPPIPPLICMPTTAGTGSEVTFVAVVTAAMQKRIVRDLHLAPALALIDPALTVSMPPALTAATGLDALSHALEALTSRMASPLSDALALEALQQIGRWLPRAFERGEDLDARGGMALAAVMAGLAFVNGRVHLGHAVGHAMGTHYKLAHGLACAMCLPALLAFLRPASTAAQERAASALGGSDLPTVVAELLWRVQAPRLGAAAGVREVDIPHLVDLVQAEDRLIGLSPRRPDADDWAQIFAQSL